MNAPIAMPTMKNKVHALVRRSNFEKYSSRLFGEHIDPSCCRLVEIPNGLPANMYSIGTTSPIKMPDIHQGQGFRNHSMISFLVFVSA